MSDTRRMHTRDAVILVDLPLSVPVEYVDTEAGPVSDLFAESDRRQWARPGRHRWTLSSWPWHRRTTRATKRIA